MPDTPGMPAPTTAPPPPMPPPWMAPWFRSPTDAAPPVGSGRTNERGAGPTRADSGVSNLYSEWFPHIMQPDSGKFPNYNMPRPTYAPYAAPWYGQPQLPHQVSAFQMPNPWMPQWQPYGWDQYQPGPPMPMWQPPQMQPMPMDMQDGWKAQPFGVGPGLGGNAAYTAQTPQPGEVGGNAVGQMMDLPWASRLPESPRNTDMQPLPPSPGIDTAPPPPSAGAFLAPWYGQGLFR